MATQHNDDEKLLFQSDNSLLYNQQFAFLTLHVVLVARFIYLKISHVVVCSAAAILLTCRHFSRCRSVLNTTLDPTELLRDSMVLQREDNAAFSSQCWISIFEKLWVNIIT